MEITPSDVLEAEINEDPVSGCARIENYDVINFRFDDDVMSPDAPCVLKYLQ